MVNLSRYSKEYRKINSKIKGYERQLNDPNTTDTDKQRIQQRIGQLEKQQRTIAITKSTPNIINQPQETTEPQAEQTISDNNISK